MESITVGFIIALITGLFVLLAVAVSLKRPSHLRALAIIGGAVAVIALGWGLSGSATNAEGVAIAFLLGLIAFVTSLSRLGQLRKAAAAKPTAAPSASTAQRQPAGRAATEGSNELWKTVNEVLGQKSEPTRSVEPTQYSVPRQPAPTPAEPTRSTEPARHTVSRQPTPAPVEPTRYTVPRPETAPSTARPAPVAASAAEHRTPEPVAPEQPAPAAPPPPERAPALRRLLTTRLSTVELRTLIFDLGLEYEALSHTTQPELVLELLLRMGQLSRPLSEIDDWLRANRPDLQS